MNNQKDLLYLACMARAIKKIAVATNRQNILESMQHLFVETESSYETLIDEAESLALGIPIDKVSKQIPAFAMTCLLETIGGNTNKDYHLHSAPLSLTKNFFPQKSIERKSNYEKLADRIESNLKNLNTENTRTLAENLLQLLFRYAISVPANELTPDVSLYDQTRITAAIAICLFEAKNKDLIDPSKPLRLIGADFSGIQSYIYQIVSKYAGKNLKGRSFYLRLLSDAVLGHILNQMNLYMANIIYDSGGCFYLLAPNTKEAKDNLDDAVLHIEQQMFKSHSTSLFVAIDSIEMSKEEMSNNSSSVRLGNLWQQLFVKRDKKKQCKYAQSISDNYNDFFMPQDVDGKKRDAITGIDFSKEDAVVKFNGDQLISLLNDKQIKLGKGLKDCDCIAVSEKELTFWKDKVSIQPAQIGRYYYLLSLGDIRKSADFIKESGNDIIIKLLNGRHGDCDYDLLPEMTSCVVSLDFYGGNTFNGNTFEDMCDNECLRRLGVLRMDVDNLGSIFQDGIPQEKASLARYAALSRSFDYFFSGYINNIVLKDENADKSFIIYSGGDDLFIVGEWDTVIRIAKTIREDFREYTCKNPVFSISGGVAILTTKYPIIAGAEESALEESNAKGHTCHGKSKDSISFMDTPLNWSDEFLPVEKLKDCLLASLLNKSLPKSFLSKILLHASMADINHHKISNMKTYWMMSYDLKRVVERTNDHNVKQIALNCQKEIWENGKQLNGEPITTDYHLLELWAFACRWAELEYRMLNN